MSRLLGPDANSRLAYIPAGAALGNAAGLTAVVYSDSAGTTRANILTYDGTETPGAAVTDSELTIATNSLIPQFWYPDSVDRVYISIGGGTPVRADADLDRRIDALLTDATLSGETTVSGSLVSTPVDLTDAATIATDASLGNHFRVTLGGSRTLGAPTNPTDGQRCIWEFIQDSGGNRVLTLASAFRLGTDITAVTLTTTGSKRDYMGAIYCAAAAKWDVVAFVKGF